MNDNRLRETYARLVDARTTADRGACPSPEALRELVDQEGTESARIATLDHVMGCSACMPELELLRAVHAAGQRRRPLAGARRAAMAAGVVLALMGGSYWLMSPSTDGPVYRAGSGAAAALVEPAGTVPLRPERLVWSSVDEAVRYRIEVLSVSGTVLWEGTTSDTVLALPQEVELVSGGTYQWRGDAILLGGSTRSLGVQSFMIRAR